MLLDEDYFRSFVQALELGDVLLPLQLSVTVLVLLNQILCSSFLIQRDGSLRTCLILFNMLRCQHATFCGFVST